MMRYPLRTCLFMLLFQISPLLAFSQLLKDRKNFSRYDSLIGSISPLRDYNVKHYDLSINVDMNKKSIIGHVKMRFQTRHPMKKIQIDLFSRYQIHELRINGEMHSFERDSNHIFIKTKLINNPKRDYVLSIIYSGKPIAAKKAPWDGGFVWEKDDKGRHWVGVACEGLGASSWWPCKDHWSDEPDDGVDIRIKVDSNYTAVSNGRLIGKEPAKKGKMQWHWRVSNPINLYNVTLNIAKYVPIFSTYKSLLDGKILDMSFWVLDYNLEKAKEQFKQVAPMMNCYESKLGAYPFYEDGYQLVETPYLGMEHQSCVAYGNKYKVGYLGNTNYTGGHDFDYIIIHETGHEWFGNNITAADNADMWIHEALTTYSESIYAECIYGKDAGDKYINNMKKRVRNKAPIQGQYNVSKEGSGDMYAKGALFFHTLKYQIDKPELWGGILKDMNQTFKKETISYDDVLNFFNDRTKKNWANLFAAYLQYPKIPKITISATSYNETIQEYSLRLDHPVPDMKLRIYYTIDGKEQQGMLSKKTEYKIRIPKTSKFELNEDKGYFKIVK